MRASEKHALFGLVRSQLALLRAVTTVAAHPADMNKIEAALNLAVESLDKAADAIQEIKTEDAS